MNNFKNISGYDYPNLTEYEKTIRRVPTGVVLNDELSQFSSVNGLSLVIGTSNIEINSAGLAEHAFNYNIAGNKISVVSTSAQDSFAGTGIQIVLLNGLDNNFDAIVEVVVLNGTTPVLTVQNFRRLNTTLILSQGSSNFAVGIISFTDSVTTGNIHAKILVGETNPWIGKICVPRNYTIFFDSVVVSTGNGDEILAKVVLNSPTIPHQDFALLFSYAGTVFSPNKAWTRAPEKTDLIFVAKSISGTAKKCAVTCVVFLISNDVIASLT